MNIDDIKTALMFLYCDDRQQIVLQCYSVKDIPYIKRELVTLLGQPDKTDYHTFYYRINGNYKTIHMVPILRDMRGYKNEDLFYVARTNGQDWQTLASNGFWLDQRLDIGAYLMTNAFGIIDVYNMLIRDGMTGQQALDTLANEDFIKV